MKSKTMKLLLSLTLVLCVALALPGLSAGADYVNSFEAGTDIGSIQVFSSNLVIKSYEKYAGSLPAGLSLSWDDTASTWPERPPLPATIPAATMSSLRTAPIPL